ARPLALMPDVTRPPPRTLPHAQRQLAGARLGRCQPLIGMGTAEQTRLAGASERLTKDITAHITWLNAAIATLDDDLETLLRASPLWRGKNERLDSAKGKGRGGAGTIPPAAPWARW